MLARYMRTTLRLACVLLAAPCALPIQGCKSTAERARDQALDQAAMEAFQAIEDAGRRTIRLGGDGGGGLVTGPTKPDDFPTDVPIYPGSTVILGGRSKGTGKPSWSLSVTTGDSRDVAIARYKELLRGFEKLSNLNMGDAALSIWRNAAYDMTLMVGTTPGANTTTITLNVASK